jgi:RNA polymerase primary sigma factor
VGEAQDSIYLDTITQAPLLDADQEVELAKRIERGRRASERLLEGVGGQKEQRALVAQIEDGVAAREHLLMANTRLVVSVASRYVGRGVPFLDLVHEGFIGLIRATGRFDYRRGNRFSTYATWWIRQAVTRAIDNHGRTIRLPVHMNTKIGRIYRASSKLSQQLGRQPTVEELAEEVDLPPEKVRFSKRVAQLPLSLETPQDEEGNRTLADVLVSEEEASPEELTVDQSMREVGQQLLELLPAREARVIRMRFGFEDGKAYTLQQIGERMGITRERARQIQKQALNRLRLAPETSGLQRFLRDA